MPTLPEITLRPGDEIRGFEVESVDEMPGIRSVAYRLLHRKTAARIVHLHNADAENLFSVAFPTPPTDDAGAPHILEHMVLAGSKRFPVRDPFFEMCKSSMATFINAMTAWDSTYYPVSSNVRRDLFNLAEVYFDAVFHPLLEEDTFKREGHHFAPADPAAPLDGLTVTGIVYNEMKGAFSDPESRLYRLAGRGVFPDTIYSNESGGDPVQIPDLTYENLKAFHDRWYHPSNAYFVLYGNIETDAYLEFLAPRLEAFHAREVVPEIGRQPRWTQPRRLEETYAIGADDTAAEKTFLVINWLVGDATDPFDVTALYILSRVLLGNDASPLRRTVIESKLGHNLVFSGLSSPGRECTFVVGIKGSEPERVDAFETLVLDNLRELAAEGLEPALIQAAFQQAAYHHLEISSQYPLACMQGVLGAWIYGGSPLTFLDMAEHLAAVEQQYAADPAMFTKLLRERIIDNPHRLTTVMKPDPAWQVAVDRAFGERMAEVRAAKSDEEVAAIAADAERLQIQAGTPNGPEALATLPQLAVTDLPPAPDEIPFSTVDLGFGARMLRGETFSNGVNYLRLHFDWVGLDPALVPYTVYYLDAMRKMGAAGDDFAAMARRKAEATGAFSCQIGTLGHAVDATAVVHDLKIGIKTLDKTLGKALDVVEDVMFRVDPRDRDRLRDVVVQRLAAYRSHFVDNGSATAAVHAARSITPTGPAEHVLGGLPQLDRCERLQANFDDVVEEIIEKVEAVRDFMLRRSRVTTSFNGTDAAATKIEARTHAWLERMADEPLGATTFAAPSGDMNRDGLAAAMQVAYCAACIPAPHTTDPRSALLLVGAHMLNMDYLVSEVRFRGNAYGAWCRYSGADQSIALGSYRDPHVTRTLGVFDGLLDYVRGVSWSQADVDRAIIGVAKRYVMPMRPQSATEMALLREIVGSTSDSRRAQYDGVRSATPDSVKRAWIEVLETNLPRASTCVVSSREKLEAANAELGERALAIRDILASNHVAAG